MCVVGRAVEHCSDACMFRWKVMQFGKIITAMVVSDSIIAYRIWLLQFLPKSTCSTLNLYIYMQKDNPYAPIVRDNNVS